MRRTSWRHSPSSAPSRAAPGRGRGARDADDPVPARGDPLQLLRPAAAQVAAGRAGLTMTVETPAEGMRYLESVPRRVVTLYLPLAVFLFVLLFPFYWMVTTSIKPNAELLSREGNPFWVAAPTLEHFKHLIFETPYPEWMWNTVIVSVVVHVHLARGERVRGLRDRAPALPRLQAGGARDLPRLPRAALDPLHPARGHRLQARPLRHALGADPHLSDVPDPVLHLAPDGLLPLDSRSSSRSAR